MTTDLQGSSANRLSSAPRGAKPMTDHDVYLFKEGSHLRLYQRLGSHPGESGGVAGCWFGVWAPNAAAVSVIGDFNGWDRASHPLQVRVDGSGVWEGFVAGAEHGHCYKYSIESRQSGAILEKGDPFAFAWEEPPRTASRIWSTGHDWKDAQWMARRKAANALDAPFSIYEVHLGSWMRPRGDPAGYLNYREMAVQLAQYAVRMGFTHVELMPVTEHPFYGSWGYQTTGYFAPTARYGTPEDFMAFVDHLHQHGIGVILDWVPSHFPGDAHGLATFDGTALYEHADPRQGFHPEWQSYIFNYGRNEVRAFLASSAMYWLDRYHVDGIRVDAVASMLYLDYGRKAGEWIPNEHGGHENLAAVSFLRDLNAAIYREYPDVQVIAEESTAWPGVSRPVYTGGLGFGMKWNMGWMHDTLAFFAEDPVNRKYHQGQLTFSLWYAFTENFLLSLSHDEVVYGKRSLLEKMPGDDWQKFANLRLLFGYMWAHPGKKLLFMGDEIGQRSEWAHDGALDWGALGDRHHETLQRWVEDLNRTYREHPALHQLDFSADGFEWIDASDTSQNVLAFLRKARDPRESIAVVCNCTPVPRHNYAIGVPSGGRWVELLNSDATTYGGSGQGNMGAVEAAPVPAHGRMHSLSLTLPPLSVLFFKAPEVNG
jgi:1,4-alpha-glucan branching enzyme